MEALTTVLYCNSSMWRSVQDETRFDLPLQSLTQRQPGSGREKSGSNIKILNINILSSKWKRVIVLDWPLQEGYQFFEAEEASSEGRTPGEAGASPSAGSDSCDGSGLKNKFQDSYAAFVCDEEKPGPYRSPNQGRKDTVRWPIIMFYINGRMYTKNLWLFAWKSNRIRPELTCFGWEIINHQITK